MPLRELVEMICERLSVQWPDLRDRALLHRLGVSCCIYSELSHHRTMDYRLSLENSVALKGNSYPYVNYAYSRIESLLAARQLGNEAHTDEAHLNELLATSSTSPEFTENCERDLASQLVLFDDVVVRAASELLPHLLCDYVYELATLFHRFYSAVRILDAATPTQRHTRLLLSVATRNTLKQALHLLAVQPIQRM
jgi:arginyl-tRNA synthetase